MNKIVQKLREIIPQSQCGHIRNGNFCVLLPFSQNITFDEASLNNKILKKTYSVSDRSLGQHCILWLYIRSHKQLCAGVYLLSF